MLKNKNYNTIFFLWLISLTILVASIIVVGGLTRLTDSGLSITEWELLEGVLPPLSQQEWFQYFDSYKKIPQYQLLNIDMTLNEFKYIYFWEYAHRLLARFIGLFFLLPFLFFILINLLTSNTIFNLSRIFILILIQGAVGWYMVKSGLIDKTSVSHYRLSIHLILAFSIFSSLIWILLNLFKDKKVQFFQASREYISLKLILVFIFIQIIIGAFVSGLDAGKIYQTWPLMNSSYFPDDASLKNFFNFDQASIVQFYHRNIAYLIFFFSIYFGYEIFTKKEKKLYSSYLVYFSVIVIQIILGISVLITGANIYIASMHQISSIFLVAAALKLYHCSIRS